VLDANGTVIGMLEKDFGKSLLRSHWHVRVWVPVTRIPWFGALVVCG
jgi:hypothetical protein